MAAFNNQLIAKQMHLSRAFEGDSSMIVTKLLKVATMCTGCYYSVSGVKQEAFIEIIRLTSATYGCGNLKVYSLKSRI